MWLWPLVAAIVVVCFYHAEGILSDPDSQWHVFIGQNIVATGVFPTTDTLSHTFGGRPWFAKEWLSQVILGLAQSAAGWRGVVVLVAAVLTLTYGLMVRQIGPSTGAPIALGLGWSSFLCLHPTVLARPHLLVFPVIVLWTIALSDGVRRQRPPWRALPLMVLWANLHAGFAMGLAIAAILALDALWDASADRRFAVFGQWLAFGVASLTAVIMTPYGAQPLLLSLSMAQTHEAVPFMDEWQPLAFTGVGIGILAFSAVAMLALILAPRVQVGRVLLVAFLTYATLRHMRFAMVLALVTPVVAGPAIAHLIWRINRALGIFQVPLVQVPARVVRAAVAVVLAIAVWFLVARPVAPMGRVYPADALASVPSDLRRERVFNSYEYGGYLISQGVKTFIDGRSDQLFLDGFITRVVTVTQAADPSGLRALLDQYAVRWALVSQKRPETALLRQMEEWRVHYENADAAVFVRK